MLYSDFRSMAANQTYQYWKTYFKQLAMDCQWIGHVDNLKGKKRFFTGDINEFIMDQRTWTASPINGNGILYLVKPQRSTNPNVAKDSFQHQGMFFVMVPVQQDSSDDTKDQAQDLADRIVNMILTRMMNDSRNGNAFLNRSVDNLKNFRITPYSVKSQSIFLGYQVSFYINAQFDQCYNPLDWGATNPQP